jgi:hypothetical protein
MAKSIGVRYNGITLNFYTTFYLTGEYKIHKIGCFYIQIGRVNIK